MTISRLRLLYYVIQGVMSYRVFVLVAIFECCLRFLEYREGGCNVNIWILFVR